MELHYLGLPTAKLNQLINAGLETTTDLAYYFPTKYYDYRNPHTSFNGLKEKERVAIIGKVIKTKQGNNMFYALIQDENKNILVANWFGSMYYEQPTKDDEIFLTGVVSYSTYWKAPQIVPDSYILNTDFSKYKKIVPIYKSIRGMSAKYLLSTLEKAISYEIDETLDDKIIKDFKLMSRNDALNAIHFPKNFDELGEAKRRFATEQLINFGVSVKKSIHHEESDFTFKSDTVCDGFKDLLPFTLTPSQDKCINELKKAMTEKIITNTLVQGDVGSGKTMIALFLSLFARENGYQTVIIAPTEILAAQHFEDSFKNVPDCVLLTAKLKAKERKNTLATIKDGSAKIIIGTHSVLSETVEYDNLALVIIDEQHRFGVKQRDKLALRTPIPHVVNMSATPIPRTLSLCIFGGIKAIYDLERPAGRIPVITSRVKKRTDGYGKIIAEVKKGNQGFIVCPLIEETETSLLSVEEVEKELKKYDKTLKVASITGKTAKKAQEEIMTQFKNNEINVLISTTIIEVGVNIPNATTMMVMNAERFGLSTLHQLRGRVGRNSKQCFCILQTDYPCERADIMCSTDNGFEIAEQDLKLRGSGDITGVKQSGMSNEMELVLNNSSLYEEINTYIDDNKELFDLH